MLPPADPDESPASSLILPPFCFRDFPMPASIEPAKLLSEFAVDKNIFPPFEPLKILTLPPI